ncbi:hypothetical protein L6241_09985 [Janibacter sp. Y6]|uniref:hypothetical protein n=1 Tax=Janibacter sp. Y6 TaxID=2913552 RepID=UPI0034A457BF
MSADDAAVVSSIAAAVSALITLGAVIVAVRSFRASRKDSQKADENAAEDRRAQSRPMLVPELQQEHLSHGTVNFVLRNWGRSAASDVHIDFLDPGPPADLDTLPDDSMLKWLYRSYAAPVTLWPPRWQLSHVYIWGVDDDESSERTLTLRLRYKGPDGHDYSDEFTIDPAPILSQTASAGSEPAKSDLNGWVKDIGTSLRALVRKM